MNNIYTLPDGQRAELINGNLYHTAPPSWIHQELVQLPSPIIGNHISDHGAPANSTLPRMPLN